MEESGLIKHEGGVDWCDKFRAFEVCQGSSVVGIEYSTRCLKWGSIVSNSWCWLTFASGIGIFVTFRWDFLFFGRRLFTVSKAWRKMASIQQDIQ